MSVSFDISHPEIQGAVRRALAEDIGGGDVTSRVCVPAKCEAQGTFLAREQQIVAGTELLPLIYEMRGGVEQLCIHKFSGASAEQGQALATVPVAYVSNWGGRLAKAGDLTARTGLLPTADQVVVDSRGIASNRTVSRIDLASGQVTHTIQVGLHPMAILWDEPRNLVYVVNGNSDSVSVIETTGMPSQ